MEMVPFLVYGTPLEANTMQNNGLHTSLGMRHCMYRLLKVAGPNLH